MTSRKMTKLRSCCCVKGLRELETESPCLPGLGVRKVKECWENRRRGVPRSILCVKQLISWLRPRGLRRIQTQRSWLHSGACL